MQLTPLFETTAPLLKSRNQTVAVAESSTAGLISAALLAIPGASSYYKGGSVIYTLESRRELLGIRRADVEGLEPLTEAMVQKFAELARKQLDATWAIAELGVAGPTGARYGHPPGISVIAVQGPVCMSCTIETHSDNREENMWAFTKAACDLLHQAVSAQQG